MTLKEHIDDIRKRLEQNEFTSEAAVRQGIIDRLLAALDWPTFDIKVVYPEYPVDSGNVDYALCYPKSKPRVFLEAKGIGKIEVGTEQLFNYAYSKGVTILILTDGQKWRFYHPAGEGTYEDRKVVELNLIDDISEFCAKFLNRYLSYKSVQAGEAAKVVAEDYRNIVNQRKIEERLPELWTELVQEEDRDLLCAVMSKAKEKVGHEPTEEQVLRFLRNLVLPSVKPKHKPDIGPLKPQPGNEKLKFKRLRVTFPGEEPIEHKNGIDTFIAVIEKLGIEDVKKLNIIRNTIPLISPSKDPKRKQHQRDEYYISSRLSADNQRKTLNKIAKGLEIDLDVKLVDKV